MQYKKFKDGIELSRLGMGNMRLPTKEDEPNAPIDYERAEKIISYAMANGVNYYDTAYVYHNGESEKFLGKAMKKYGRKSYYLATKFFILANPDYKSVFEEQLKKLDTDYIDFYLIHGIFDHTAEKYIESGCIEYFAEQKKKGRIKYLGFSSHSSPDVLKKFADLRKWDFAQLQINYYDWVNGTSKQEYEILTERNIPIMVMEPVRGGKLAKPVASVEEKLNSENKNWSAASWALRWVRQLENVYVILSGMSSMEQITDNINTFSDDKIFGERENNILIESAKKIKNALSVPCTSCRYCCDDCPKGIEIPKILSIYNKMKLDGVWRISDMINALPENKRPADCIGCGACQGHCPQSIAIPDIMKKLSEIK